MNRNHLINTKLNFEKAIAELVAAKDCALACQEIWPKGQGAIEKVVSGIELFIKAFRIQIQIQEILWRPDSMSSLEKRVNQLMVEGRKHAERADTIFMEGISRIEKSTGYQFEWETHADDDLPF